MKTTAKTSVEPSAFVLSTIYFPPRCLKINYTHNNSLKTCSKQSYHTLSSNIFENKTCLLKSRFLVTVSLLDGIQGPGANIVDSFTNSDTTCAQKKTPLLLSGNSRYERKGEFPWVFQERIIRNFDQIENSQSKFERGRFCVFTSLEVKTTSTSSLVPFS